MRLIHQETEIQEISEQLPRMWRIVVLDQHLGTSQPKGDGSEESMINFGQLIIVQFVGPKTRVRGKKGMDELGAKMEPLRYF